MTAEAAPLPGPGAEAPVATPTTAYKLTRGAVYMLEGLLGVGVAWPGEKNTKRANKLWGKLHRLNPCEKDGIKFAKSSARPEGMTDLQWQTEVVRRNDLFDAWQDEPFALDLTQRETALLHTGIEWAIKNRDKVWPQNNQHIGAILDAFDVGDE